MNFIPVGSYHVLSCYFRYSVIIVMWSSKTLSSSILSHYVFYVLMFSKYFSLALLHYNYLVGKKMTLQFSLSPSYGRVTTFMHKFTHPQIHEAFYEVSCFSPDNALFLTKHASFFIRMNIFKYLRWEGLGWKKVIIGFLDLWRKIIC